MAMQEMQNTSVRVSAETKKRIEQIAKQKRRKPTELMRIILEDYVKQFDGIEIEK